MVFEMFNEYVQCVNGGIPYANVCGIFCKELGDLIIHDCLCQSLCDVYHAVYQSHKSRNNDLLFAMLSASLFSPSQRHMEVEKIHLSNLGFSYQETRNEVATWHQVQTCDHDDGLLHVLTESMIGESSRQLPGVCLQRDSHDETLSLWKTLGHGVQ